MGTFTSWVRTRKAAASTVAITLLAGVPLTFAVLHQGFPVTDVDLAAREARPADQAAVAALAASL